MSKSPYIKAVTGNDFQQQVIARSEDMPVMVDFWAAWCGPCKMLEPVLEKVVEHFGGKLFVAKVDTDEEQRLAGQFGIRSLPTMMLFRHGEVIDQVMGVQAESALIQLVEKALDKPSDAMRKQARELIMAGKPDEAVSILQEAVKVDPDNFETVLDLVEALLASGNKEEAENRYNELPADIQMSDRAKTLHSKMTLSVAASADLEDLRTKLAANPDDLVTRLSLAASLIATGDMAAGLEEYLQVLQKDREFDDGAARKGLLAAFDVIDDAALVKTYRRKMSSILF